MSAGDSIGSIDTASLFIYFSRRCQYWFHKLIIKKHHLLCLPLVQHWFHRLLNFFLYCGHVETSTIIMGPRTRNCTNSTISEIIEVCVSCSSEKSPVQTKVLVPAGFDVTPSFSCGFCAANFHEEKKSYESAVDRTLKNGKTTRAALFSEIDQNNLKKNRKNSILSKERRPLI